MVAKNYYYALGRRKSSTATARLIKGNGLITINNKPSNEYFSESKYLITKLAKPFETIDMQDKFDVSIVVKGGGSNSQVDAIRLAIAKSLVVFDPELRATLKKADLLGRDPRAKERKKFGLKGARKQRQFTKR
ncbi:MAG TPA: 30S ribosomal protein S9 [Candidatus Dormibacteraeota bacterium]|nr:30S ribosomal protein S9 [Candidatus Dormibacteraeota bacterium]